MSRGVPALWGATLAMLALPRALGVLAVVLRREQGAFGGTAALLRSALLEAGLSVLQAPLRLVAHSVFVLGALTGWKLQWTSPPRQAMAVGWADATQRFAPAAAGSVLATVALWGQQAAALLALLPVLLPLWLAPPLAVLTSRGGLGERLRRRGWLAIPEETQVPPVLVQAWGCAPCLVPGAGRAKAPLNLVPAPARGP
jgi:membrane glycosyltransferase